MMRAHHARTGVATAAPTCTYEYRIDRHDRRMLLVRRHWTRAGMRGVTEWTRWGRFSTPRQAVNAYIMLSNPSEDEGKSQVNP